MAWILTTWAAVRSKRCSAGAVPLPRVRVTGNHTFIAGLFSSLPTRRRVVRIQAKGYSDDCRGVGHHGRAPRPGVNHSSGT